MASRVIAVFISVMLINLLHKYVAKFKVDSSYVSENFFNYTFCSMLILFTDTFIGVFNQSKILITNFAGTRVLCRAEYLTSRIS